MTGRFIIVLSLAFSVLSLFIATNYKTERVHIYCKYHNSVYLEKKPVLVIIEEDSVTDDKE